MALISLFNGKMEFHNATSLQAFKIVQANIMAWKIHSSYVIGYAAKSEYVKEQAVDQLFAEIGKYAKW